MTQNPIIAAIKRGGKPPSSIVLDMPEHKVSDAAVAELVCCIFSQETRLEIGDIILRAMLTNDFKVVKMVNHGIRKANRIFRRNLEPVLLRQALQVIWDNHGKPFKKNLKQAVEARFYDGQVLPTPKWNRVRVQLNWGSGRLKREPASRILREAKQTLKRLEAQQPRPKK
jgi:hypothetical protein